MLELKKNEMVIQLKLIVVRKYGMQLENLAQLYLKKKVKSTFELMCVTKRF